VLRYRAHQSRRLAELGVGIHLGAEVTAETVAGERPDAVVVATGAAPLVPPIPGIDGPHVHDAQRLLRGEVPVAAGDRVVVIGGSATGCETAELIVAAGAAVTIVEMRGSVGRGIEAITRRQLVRALHNAGVAVRTRTTVVGIEPDGVVVTDPDGARRTIAADVVALAIGWRPTGADLAVPAGVEVRVLGDAEEAADFVRAVNTGADAGLAV
jgi:2,4-dienoyl-CoA reductase (NADPH2)